MTRTGPDEFELIRRFFTTAPAEGVVLGPGDDAAVLEPTPGRQLVVTTDTLVENRHFPDDLPPEDIGWRSLAANLSDLAAMGARPRWCLLALSLPSADETWLQAFCDGFFRLAGDTGVQLVGGDITRGPLSITVQALGEVAPGQALRRSGARPGDRVCIGGVPGEAAAGLRAWRRGERTGPAVERFCRPCPQLALGQNLVGQATACIDISDGLLADLGHILRASGELGACLQAGALPDSDALAGLSQDERRALQCGGGDDYLLLFTLPEETPLPEGCFELGVITESGGAQLVDDSGRVLPVDDPGWRHFP